MSQKINLPDVLCSFRKLKASKALTRNIEADSTRIRWALKPK